MIKAYLKENKNVIIFFILFAIGLNIFVIGVCQLIPERLRKGGWFIAPNYKSQTMGQSIEKKFRNNAN